MELDKSLEESWRGLISETSSKPNLHWLKKRLEEQRIASLKARALFEELNLAERVLKEHEK